MCVTRYYDLLDIHNGILKKGREILLTGCYLRTAAGQPRLLPTEYLVILLDEVSFNIKILSAIFVFKSDMESLDNNNKSLKTSSMFTDSVLFFYSYHIWDFFEFHHIHKCRMTMMMQCFQVLSFAQIHFLPFLLMLLTKGFLIHCLQGRYNYLCFLLLLFPRYICTIFILQRCSS